MNLAPVSMQFQASQCLGTNFITQPVFWDRRKMRKNITDTNITGKLRMGKQGLNLTRTYKAQANIILNILPSCAKFYLRDE